MRLTHTASREGKLLSFLRRELGLPQTLAQAGIPVRELRENMTRIVEAVLEDPCCETNPMKAEDFLIRRVLEEVAGHG